MGRCQSSGVGARRSRPRSRFGGWPGHPPVRRPRTTNARAETQARRRRGASGDGRPRPNRNRTGRQERGGVRRRRGPQAQPTALHTDTSVLRVSHHAPSRESRGHGRSTLRSVVLITTKPDRGADVPQMYRVRRHRRIEAPTPVWPCTLVKTNSLAPCRQLRPTLHGWALVGT